MTAAGIVAFLAERGHTVALAGADLAVQPELDAELTSRVSAREPEIVAFLRELGAPAAVSHFFVAHTNADGEIIREFGVCIACGIPWKLHGRQPERVWRRVDDPDSVALVEAVSMVIAAASRRG